MILVTGATGHLGGAAAQHLLKHLERDQFAILARDENKAKKLKDQGVEVRIGDFDDEESLDKALKGVSKVLLIPTIMPHRLEQNKRLIDVAVDKGVQHIVYTGVSHRNIETSAVQGLDDHFKTEHHILESGLTYTFLRNNLYMDLVPFYAGENVFETGFYLPAGNGKVPFALRREMGEAAANVLLQDGHENKIYDIAGNALYSYQDVADTLSKISGKKVTYTAAETEAFKEQLKEAGVDDFINFVITSFNVDIKNGQFEIVTNDLEKLLGRVPANLEKGIQEVFGL
ncbi:MULTISPECIES: SDR family oxidoreductase [unclassified Sphingobacterium]|uniref:SDR family oxidoreductase n=1 Tax=unclassified Sphingobacterium TaxID=2609468 RepID=UPI0025F21830|nr:MULTISPECIES: SDR family oxidoreductase [unclassified Sphingobacterium]